MATFDINYEDGLNALDTAVDTAEATVIKMGLHPADRPTDRRGEFAEMPRLPVALDDAKYPELQRLLGEFTVWYDYAIGQLRQAEIRRNGADEKRTFSWAKIRKLKDGTVADKDDSVRTDSRYVTVNAALLETDSVVRLLNGIVDGLKRDIDTVSRAIAALDARTNVEGRGAAVARRQESDTVRDVFRTGRRQQSRSALDTFKKGRR